MSQTLTRSGLVVPSADKSDPVHPVADLRAIGTWIEANALIALPADVFANRPAASTYGRVFHPTDSSRAGEFWFDTGSAWVQISPPPTTKILASDQTVSATSATDVPGMSVTVDDGTYEVNFSLYGITGATAGSGLTFGLAASGGVTTAAYHGMKNASAINWISGTSTLTEGFTPGGSSQPFWLFGRQVMTVGAGAISLQAYRSTSNATVKATLTNMTVTPTS